MYQSFTIVFILQLTGSVLDDAWKERKQDYMEELIQRIENILLDATCSRCVYRYGFSLQLVLEVCTLNLSKWKRQKCVKTEQTLLI